MPNNDSISQSECRKCGRTIYWHTSRNGKKYPTDSESRSDFHQCAGGAPLPKLAAANPEPTTCGFEPTVEERLTALEKQIADLCRTVHAIRGSQPIDDSDVGW